jgi:hypothetical protein
MGGKDVFYCLVDGGLTNHVVMVCLACYKDDCYAHYPK